MKYKMKVWIENPNTPKGMSSEMLFVLNCKFFYDEEQYGKKTYLSIKSEDGRFNSYYDLRYDENYNRNEKERFLEYWANSYWSGENGAYAVKSLKIEKL